MYCYIEVCYLMYKCMYSVHNLTPPYCALHVHCQVSDRFPFVISTEFNLKGSMSHSPISNVYNEVEHPSPRHHPSQMYAMGGGQMRGGPPFRPVSDPAAPAMMYRGYYNMPVMPHGESLLVYVFNEITWISYKPINASHSSHCGQALTFVMIL